MPSPLLIRPAIADDLDQIANLDRLAFAPDVSLEQVKTDWFQNTLEQPGRAVWLAIDPQTNLAVGTYTALELGIWFMGQTIPTTGIAAVAVAPHKRGQRVAQQLLHHAIAQARSQHSPLMMLYPFQHGFYRQLGWGWVGRSQQYRVSTRHLPLYPERSQIQPYQPIYRDHLPTVYEAAAARHNGWLHRQPRQWDKRLKPTPGQEVYLYVNDDVDASESSPTSAQAIQLQGYVILQFTTLDTNGHKPAVIVQEWVALNAAAYRGILGFLASLRDQVATVIWNTHTDDPFPHLLTEQRRDPALIAPAFEFGLTHAFGEIGGGFMWRLVDLPRAFGLRPIASGDPFQISFTVMDAQAGDHHEQRFTVQFGNRRMECIEYSPTCPHITLSISHLVQLFSGFRHATELHWTGEIQIQGEGDFLQQLDHAWATTAPFCWDFF